MCCIALYTSNFIQSRVFSFSSIHTKRQKSKQIESTINRIEQNFNSTGRWSIMNFDEKSLMIYIRKAELRGYLNLFFLSLESVDSAYVVCTTWMNEAKERNRVPWIFYSFHTVVSYSLLLTRNKEVWECIYYVGITFAIFQPHIVIIHILDKHEVV